MENLEIYEKGRQVPPEALKPITAGRLKGMSDINPMWRIKKLTEIFGPCGIGWGYTITDKRIVEVDDGYQLDNKTNALFKKDNGQACAFVDIDFWYKYGDEISKPFSATGGSMLAARESKGIHISDECFKMALTDAISVAAKALGIAADVYYEKDRTKYSAEQTAPTCAECGQAIRPTKTKSAEEVAEQTKAKFGKPMCATCARNHEG